MSRFDVIFIGTSAGGVTALQNLFSSLNPSFKTPIIVTQHMPKTADIDPSLIFRSTADLIFQEAFDKVKIESGHVYFAPPDYHLLLEASGHIALDQEVPVNFARPSIDVMFESAAQVYRERACGVLLTGANFDGAKGLHRMAKMGGYTIVQDPVHSENQAMPQAALDLFRPNFVGTIQQIAENLASLDLVGNYE